MLSQGNGDLPSGTSCCLVNRYSEPGAVAFQVTQVASLQNFVTQDATGIPRSCARSPRMEGLESNPW